MLFVLLFFIELSILFFSSHLLTRGISKLVHHVSKSKSVTIHFLSFLFLPGVLIHELSHFFMAIALFVPVGEIDLLPKVHGNSVRLGSVQVGKTDFVRRAMIGFAPFLIGGAILIFVSFYFLPDIFIFSKSSIWQILIVLYCIFQIGNTMFSSRKDIEGAIELLLVIFSIAVVILIFHVQIPSFITDLFSSQKFLVFFKSLDIFLLLPLLINFFLIALIKILLYKIYN